jgi:urease accessory protein UreE
MHVDLIREALHKQPFQEFTFRLTDGRALFVRHPDFVAVSNRQVIVVNAQDESVSWIEPLLIISIEYAAAGQSTNSQQGNGAQS